MSNLKLIISIGIFAILLGITSAIKNQTRIIEKNTYKIKKRIVTLKKALNETQLAFYYLNAALFQFFLFFLGFF